jgi:Nuclear pore complex scaffold, nucleoporins 186/192/205
MLFVDFIYYLPFKLKELRVQAEDTARMIEDCERARKPLPDNLQRDYEYFLELVCVETLFSPLRNSRVLVV